MGKHFKTDQNSWDIDEPDGLDVDPDELENLMGETRKAVFGDQYSNQYGRPEPTYVPPTEYPDVQGSPYGDDVDSFVPMVSPGAKNGARRFNDSAYADSDPYGLEGTGSKKKRRRGVRLLSNILFILGILLLLVAAGMWGKQQWEYHVQDVETEKLQAYARVNDGDSQPPEVDWAALKAVNEDVCGWIQIPGTVVNYPVYYGESNEEYLRTNAEGNYAVGGQVFLDYLNTNPGMIDHQSIIYGHHLYNGTMFKTIADMDNQQMFDSVKTVWYVTEAGAYELQPLFLYYTHPEDTNVRRFEFATNGLLQDYLLDIMATKGVTKCENAEQITLGVTRVLTLATCNYYEGQGRTLLVCALKAEAEEALAGIAH